MTGWKIGSATVTPVIELTLPVPGTLLIPQATPEALAPYADWLRPGYMTEQGQINLTIQAFLVESRGRKIIVDTCVGNGKTRPAPFNELDTPFLQHITDAGFPPEKVDTVICTHLHVDHVGWNTKKVDGEWVPTFPNARYVMARADYDHFEPRLTRTRPPSSAIRCAPCSRRDWSTWSIPRTGSRRRSACCRRPVTLRVTAASRSPPRVARRR